MPQDNITLIKTKVANTSVTKMSVTKNRENKEVYSFSVSSVQNTKIIIFNEETENSVVITPIEDTLVQFELSPFFIEELRQSALGNADRYLVLEIGIDFSVINVTSVSTASREMFIPRYFYGQKENVKEALPKDRQIVNIFKEKPKLIPAFPDDPENLRYVAQLEEEMSYYVYMYQLPDGTLCIYDEHFNPITEKNKISNASKSSSDCCISLPFILSGNMTGQGYSATLYALNLWSEKLVGTVPVDINVTITPMGTGILGGSYTMPHYLINGIYYPSSLANQLLGYNFSTQRDIRIEMNSNYSWYYGLDGNTSGYDWVNIMLHEVTHGLGFVSLCGSNGTYLYGSYPGIFDCQLYQGATGNTCLTDLTQSQRAALVISNNLYAGRPNSYLLEANSGNRIKMYAPNPWRSGSSVSHWNNNPGFTNFMQYAYQSPLHVFNSRKIAIMRDIGWNIYCPPASVFVNFTNQIVTTDTTVTSPGDINVQNVKVQNGAELILDATCTVNIISDFEIPLGSELEIK